MTSPGEGDRRDLGGAGEDEDDERLPTQTVRPARNDDDETVRPSGPPPPAVAPSDPMDGTTKDEPAPSNPFAGLLAEAQAKPNRGKPSTEIVRERARADAVASTPPKSADEADTVDQTPKERRKVGPYRILEEIGSGGMAVVYKATQPALDRLVAIKELRGEYVHDRQIATRFEREATSLATLQHGNIVHVYDFIRSEQAAYIVMEYVDGVDLFDVLAETETLPPDIAAICALQVAEGLEYAHYRGIVHRDVKPSNVLISRRGEVKLMDFGIARDPGKSELTQVGLAVGTPAYMAPEQIRGDKIDFRTDVFAVGILLYEMLAGEKPWPEESGRSVTVKVLDEPPVPLTKVCPGAPKELVSVVDRCLHKEPAQRYASTFELRRDIERYVQQTSLLDPRGRLVLFLKNRGFVPASHARTFVAPDMLDDPLIARRDAGIPPPPPRLLLEPVATAHGIGLGVVLLTGLLGALAPFGDPLPEPPRAAPIAAPAAAPAPVPAAGAPEAAGAAQPGYVRVVVDPWARVLVDGRYHDTTPFAAPIRVAPGTHRISLRNPYFEASDRIVEVEPGETVELKAALIPRALEGRRGPR